MKIILAWAVFVFASWTSASFAGEGPFAGYFTFRPPGSSVSPESDQINCAFSFFRQGHDDTGSDYVLNIKAYLEDNRIEYSKIDDFKCDYHADSQLESCTITNHTTSGETTTQSWQKYLSISLLEAEVFYFIDQGSFDADLEKPNGSPAETDVGKFVRCVGLTEDNIKPYLSASPNTLSEEDKTAAMAVIFTGANGELMKQIGTTINAKIRH